MRSESSALRGAQFVDPSVLARIGNLELLARTVVDGFINGLHRAPHLGFSLDFAEHRGYEPGDDLRRVDWRVFARTDRFYVKQFEADSNANCLVALDTSPSMRYGSGSLTKLDYGRYLAASLLYFSHQQRDRVGLATFDTEVRDYVPPSAKHLEFALYALDRLDRQPAAADRQDGRPAPAAGLVGPLLTLTERLSRRGIVAVVSDLYAEPEAVVRAVRPLRFRGHDVVVFHVLDPAELTFPFTDAATFEDLESGGRLPIVPDAVRDEYRRLVRAHVDALSQLFVDSRIDYALFDSSVPLDHALFRYLATRERLARAR
jgi:uncharacterized protein (DUF58 family)